MRRELSLKKFAGKALWLLDKDLHIERDERAEASLVRGHLAITERIRAELYSIPLQNIKNSNI